MKDLFQTSMFAGVTLSLLAYLAGLLLKKKFKLGIFNPLLISIILTIIVLVCAHIDYDTYNKGAVYLSWFLTPATVCLAIPLYEQWQLLKRNVKAVMLGITAGVLTSLTTVFVLSKLMGLTHQDDASEVHYDSYWYGSIGRTWRLCDNHGCRHRSNRCDWQHLRRVHM